MAGLSVSDFCCCCSHGFFSSQCNYMDHALHSLWCNYGYSVEKGIFCNTRSLIYIDFFRCILLQKKEVRVAGQSFGCLPQAVVGNHLYWCADARLNLKLALATSLCVSVLSHWYGNSGEHSVVDEGQCFKPYFWSAWGFVLGKPRISKLKDWIVPFAVRAPVECEGCRSLWLMGGGKLGASVLFVFVKYLQWPRWSSPFYKSCISLPTKVKISTWVL